MKRIYEVKIKVNIEDVSSYFFEDSDLAVRFLNTILNLKPTSHVNTIEVETLTYDLFENEKDVNRLFLQAKLFAETLTNQN